MLRLERQFRALFWSSLSLQGYALLLFSTSVTVAGAMFLTAEIVLTGVSLNSLQVTPLVADLGALATAPYMPDVIGLRFRGLRADVAEEARRDSTARASTPSGGGFGVGGDALVALLDPSRSGAPASLVETIVSTATAIAAAVTPLPRGPEGSGPVLAPPAVAPVATVVTAMPSPTLVPTVTAPPTATLAPTPAGTLPVGPTVVVGLPPAATPSVVAPSATPTPVVPTTAPPPAEPPVTPPPAAGGSDGGVPGTPPPSPSAEPSPSPQPSATPAPTSTRPPATPPPLPSTTALPVVPPPDLGEPVREIAFDLRSLFEGWDHGGGSGQTVFTTLAARVTRPGDTFVGPLRVANAGRRPFSYTLRLEENTLDGTASPLFNDPINGMQIKLTRRVGGDTVTIYEGPVKFDSIDMHPKVEPGRVDDLGIQIYYPIAMPNSFQGQTTNIRFVWTATEVAP